MSKPIVEILDVKLTGAVLYPQKALAHFVARGGGGKIVICSSVHQIIPKPGYLAHSISKGAMASLTCTLALELGGVSTPPRLARSTRL